MTKIKTLFIALASVLLVSCDEDDSCALNGQVNGDCFEVVEVDYDIQNLSSNGEPFTRENLFLGFQFDNGIERYRIPIRSNEYGGETFRVGGVDYRFQTGVEYNENSLTFDSNTNAPQVGTLNLTFSKVDRENGLVSGSFDWVGTSNGTSTTTLSGSFTDVEVSLEN